MNYKMNKLDEQSPEQSHLHGQQMQENEQPKEEMAIFVTAMRLTKRPSLSTVKYGTRDSGCWRASKASTDRWSSLGPRSLSNGDGASLHGDVRDRE